MFMRVLKWSAIAALFGGALSRSLPTPCVALQFAVAAAALVILAQAARMGRYVWMTLFLIVACLFNPVFPIHFSSYTFDVATTFAAFLFFFSLELLQPQRPLATAPVADSRRGSRSL